MNKDRDDLERVMAAATDLAHDLMQRYVMESHDLPWAEPGEQEMTKFAILVNACAMLTGAAQTEQARCLAQMSPEDLARYERRMEAFRNNVERPPTKTEEEKKEWN